MSRKYSPNHPAVPPSKWRKGTVITLNGEPYILTSKPKKAIDGSWITFMTDTEGKGLMQYIKDEQIEGLKS